MSLDGREVKSIILQDSDNQPISIVKLAAARDGRVAIADLKGRVWLLSNTGEIINNLGRPDRNPIAHDDSDGGLTHIAFDSNGTFVSGSNKGILRWWSKLGDPQKVEIEGGISNISFDFRRGMIWAFPKSNHSTSGDASISSVEVDSGELKVRRIIRGRGSPSGFLEVNALLCCYNDSPGQSIMVISSSERVLLFEELNDGSDDFKELTIFPIDNSSIASIHVFPRATGDRVKLLQGGQDGHIRTWSIDASALKRDALGLRQELDISGHRDSITSMSFLKDENILFSTARDGRVNLWNLSEDRADFGFRFLRGKSITSAALNGQADQAVLGDHEGKITLLNSDDWANIEKSLRVHSGSITAIKTYGDSVLAGDEDGAVWLWTLDVNAEKIMQHSAPINLSYRLIKQETLGLIVQDMLAPQIRRIQRHQKVKNGHFLRMMSLKKRLLGLASSQIREVTLRP